MKLRKIGTRNKKGITPIIAVILLMMMTVAAAGAAFFWVLRMQSSFQGGSEQHFENLGSNINSMVDITHSQYKDNGNFTLILQNTGSIPITLASTTTSPTTNIILKDENSNLICSETFGSVSANCTVGCGGSSLSVGGQTMIVVNLSTNCDISNATSYPNGSLFYFDLDFGGQAATGSKFEK
jgi:flagellin-like protein|tara:strand:+ start:818 stop:1363 length:546 start_codon:yes stop_codon:yes gene_type:complete